MIQTIQLTPGVILRYAPDSRFKKGAISIQLLRPMCEAENAFNALLPAVMLRGTRHYPDLQSITQRLDDLYGASIGTMVRRIGDIQTVGFYLSFMEDRFALAGDEILKPMIGFLEETMLRPKMEQGIFDKDFVESEKKNLISTIESELNDKRAYAAGQMLRRMCAGDSFAVPRLGRKEAVAQITPEALTAHYHHILIHSPVEIFYAGSADADAVAALLMPLAKAIQVCFNITAKMQSGYRRALLATDDCILASKSKISNFSQNRQSCFLQKSQSVHTPAVLVIPKKK